MILYLHPVRRLNVHFLCVVCLLYVRVAEPISRESVEHNSSLSPPDLRTTLRKQNYGHMNADSDRGHHQHVTIAESVLSGRFKREPDTAVSSSTASGNSHGNFNILTNAVLNCILANSSLHVNATEVVVISFSQDHSINGERISGVCTLHMEAPAGQVLSVVIRRQTCTGKITVSVHDVQGGGSQVLTGCGPWSPPGGRELRTSNRSGRMVMSVVDWTGPYSLEVNVVAVDEPLRDKLFTRFLSSTSGRFLCGFVCGCVWCVCVCVCVCGVFWYNAKCY